MYKNLKERWIEGESPIYSVEDLHWVGFITTSFVEMFNNKVKYFKF